MTVEVASSADLTDAQRELVERVRSKVEFAEDTTHKRAREKWERMYAMYRSYRELRETYKAEPSQPGKDEILRAAQSTFGAQLVVPWAFAVVETVVPRLLSNRPRMLVLPRASAAERNVEHMKHTIDAQQEQLTYELRLQDTAKAGLIYGLGIQKVTWRVEKRKTHQLAPHPYKPDRWVPVVKDVTVWDDPWVEDVDPFDFLWDPFGDSIETCEWVCQRTWRSTRYVLEQMQAGVWEQLPEENVRSLASSGTYDEVWGRRLEIEGKARAMAQHERELHEVWEWHNGSEVVTVLDRLVPVQHGRNPFWHGRIPYVTYRPTKVPKRFEGIGEIEPIEDLTHELNTLRQQRRDNATFVLQQVIAYQEGSVDPTQLKFGPGTAFPTLAPPGEALMPLKVGDIPNSGYQEEANLMRDIERTTGISDPLAGGGGGVHETATGVQLLQAAANARIQNKTRRVEIELCKPATEMFVAMNQQKIVSEREVRVEAAPTPQEPNRRWTWFKIGPAELQGNFAIEPEGGASAPDNVPQMRQDAMQLSNLLAQRPEIDQQMLVKEVLRLFGIKQPESWLVPDMRVPMEVLHVLVERFQVPQEAIEQALMMVEQQKKAEELEEGTHGHDPAQNGAGPQQEQPVA